MFTLPNILTLLRIALLPALVGLFYITAPWAAWTALGLYIFAAITDFLDGWLARKTQSVSAFGTFLDPIADKIFVAVLLLALIDTDRLSDFWAVPAMIILVREFLIAGLREYLGPQNIKLPVSKLAKWKTTVQMIAIGALIIGPQIPHGLEIGQYGLAIAAVLTVTTGWSYMKTGLTHIARQK